MNSNKVRAQVHNAVNKYCDKHDVKDDPYLAQRILNAHHTPQMNGGIVVKKKLSVSFVLMMVAMLLCVAALAATILWRDAGEKVAPLESENGYYDTWKTEEKVELVRELYDFGELKDIPDVDKLLNSTDMPEAEKDALCDSIMSTYVAGTPDTVTLLSILEELHGDMSTWSMEDLVWYNELLAANDMLSSEDTNYVLLKTGEITEQVVDAAKTFLMSKGATNLNEAQIKATMYEETDDMFYGDTHVSQKGRRGWSVVFRPNEAGTIYGGTCHVDVTADGSVIAYSLPALDALFITGILPDADAISESKAIEIGTKAIATQLSVSEEQLIGVKCFFGYINLADEDVAHAKLGEHVWVIDANQYYALLSPAGDVIFVGHHN